MTRLCSTRLTWNRSLVCFHLQTLWRVPASFWFLSPQSSKPIGYWQVAWKSDLPSQSRLVFSAPSSPLSSALSVPSQTKFVSSILFLCLRWGCRGGLTWWSYFCHLRWQRTICTGGKQNWENQKWAVPCVKRGFTPRRGCSGVSSKQLHGVVQPFSPLHFHPPSWRISSNLSLNSNTDNHDEFFKRLHRAAGGAPQLLFLSSSCEEFRSAPCDFVH